MSVIEVKAKKLSNASLNINVNPHASSMISYTLNTDGDRIITFNFSKEECRTGFNQA